MLEFDRRPSLKIMSSAKPEPPAAESVRVNIFGQTYSLRSSGGGERVRRVAGLVDERMREIAAQLAVHDAAKVAVLAALNLADEMELVREHYEREIESLLMREPEPERFPPAAAEPAPAATAETSVDASAGAADERERESVRGALATAEEGTAPAGETKANDESAARRSWFDEIFDTEFSPGGGPGRLSSQVSSRLQRLRQATRESTISDGEARED
jgi:cell division protein ZapA